MKIRVALLSVLVSSVFIITSCDTSFLTPSNSNIDGSWKCQEVHEVDGTRNYYIDIEYNAKDSSIVYLYNFLFLDQNNSQTSIYATAYINGFSIEIPQQTIDGHSVIGSGSVSVDYKTIELSFTDDLYGGIPAQVSATLERY